MIHTKEQNEIAGTVANIGMALCEDSLSIVFAWCSSFINVTNNTPQNYNQKSSTSKFATVKWGLRSQSIQIDFTLENDLSCQLLIESSKSKGQGALKGIGCKGKSFSETLILIPVNPQCDKRLFINLSVQYKNTTRSECVVYTNYFCLDIQNNLCTQHVLSL